MFTEPAKISNQNSVNQILITLSNNPNIPENEIMKLTFGYDRNNTYKSNKKYADMLRRGVRKGIIEKCVNNTGKYTRCKFVYRLPIEQKTEIMDLSEKIEGFIDILDEVDLKQLKRGISIIIEAKKTVELYHKYGTNPKTYDKFIVECLKVHTGDKDAFFDYLEYNRNNNLPYPSSGSLLVGLEDFDNIINDWEFDEAEFRILQKIYQAIM